MADSPLLQMIRISYTSEKHLSAVHTAVEQNLKILRPLLWENKMFLSIQKTKYTLFDLKGQKSSPAPIKPNTNQINTVTACCRRLENVDTYK